MIKIGIDVFGGDNAPEAVVEGAIASLSELGDSCRIVFIGDSKTILDQLESRGCSAELFDIVHAPERIEMGDHPAESFRTKKQSSIAVGFQMLAAGQIDGFASAGSTGAMMVGSMMVVKPLLGVLRPTIAISIPTVAGGKVTILDIGINVDCRAEVLEQYAVLGSLYASEVLGISLPRVALLNIGEESSKGNAQYQLMAEASAVGRYNFVGNVEASHIYTGDVADVVVCDGFVGNTVLKLTEGLYSITSGSGDMSQFWRGLNYEQTGGTPVLGVGAVVTIGHGKSTPLAIKNMILSTLHSVETDLVGKLREKF